MMLRPSEQQGPLRGNAKNTSEIVSPAAPVNTGEVASQLHLEVGLMGTVI